MTDKITPIKVDKMAELRSTIKGEQYREWVLIAVTEEGYYSLSYTTDVFRASWLLDRAKEMAGDLEDSPNEPEAG